MLTSQTVIIGADVSQESIVLAWAGEQRRCQSIANTRKAILAWLTQLPPQCAIGMEATGRLHQLLAELAAEHGHLVYVLNPKHVAAYARSLGQRGKTDMLDAAVIARYLQREGDRLHPYTPPTPLQRTLRDLISQRAAVGRYRAALKQCLKATSDQAQRSLKCAQQTALNGLTKLLSEIDHELQRAIAEHAPLEQQRKHMQTIPGIGWANSASLTHRFDRTAFANSDAVVAAYGIDPRPRESGKFVGKRRLTKQGNSEDRRLIYLAAQSAARTKYFRPLYQDLRARGFATTEAIVILARKLLRIAFAVWKSGQPFDPQKVGKNACARP